MFWSVLKSIVNDQHDDFPLSSIDALRLYSIHIYLSESQKMNGVRSEPAFHGYLNHIPLLAWLKQQQLSMRAFHESQIFLCLKVHQHHSLLNIIVVPCRNLWNDFLFKSIQSWEGSNLIQECKTFSLLTSILTPVCTVKSQSWAFNQKNAIGVFMMSELDTSCFVFCQVCVQHRRLLRRLPFLIRLKRSFT